MRQQNNIQGAGTYRSGTGYGCPHRSTVPIIICHQSPPVRCWSCDNINKHTPGTRTYLSGSGCRFPIILSPIHTCLVLVMFDNTGYPGCQFLPARYRLHLPFEFFAIILSLGPTGPVLFMWQDIDIHGVLAPTGMVLVKALVTTQVKRVPSSYPFTDCFIILSPIPAFLMLLVMWQQNRHTGFQSLPVRYRVWLPSQICPLIFWHQCPPVWCLVMWQLK